MRCFMAFPCFAFAPDGPSLFGGHEWIDIEERVFEPFDQVGQVGCRRTIDGSRIRQRVDEGVPE